MDKTGLVDTHCHLYLEEFEKDLHEVMLRADHEGVRQIFLPSLDVAHLSSMYKLEEKYPEVCHAMIGLHPCYVNENYVHELEVMADWASRRRFAAVGEIGLDYYWSREFDNYQKIAFVEQIRMAAKYDLPIVIHSRESMEDCIAILQSEKPAGMKGIFHCFSGTLEQARRITGMGMMLGIGGVVTYKNAGLAEVIAQLPVEHIVLETDAPYLTPVPFRGKRNESSYLKYILNKIAQIKGVEESEIARITTENANAVFGRQ